VCRRSGRELDDAEVVAERVAETTVDAIGVLGWFFAELDAARLKGLVGLTAVGCCEAEGEPTATLADRLANLGGGLLVHPGRGGELEQYVAARIAGDPDGQPAHEAEVHVIADLQPKFADIEIQSLVLVENKDVRDVDGVEHRDSPFLCGLR